MTVDTLPCSAHPNTTTNIITKTQSNGCWVWKYEIPVKCWYIQLFQSSQKNVQCWNFHWLGLDMTKLSKQDYPGSKHCIPSNQSGWDWRPFKPSPAVWISCLESFTLYQTWQSSIQTKIFKHCLTGSIYDWVYIFNTAQTMNKVIWNMGRQKWICCF